MLSTTPELQGFQNPIIPGFAPDPSVVLVDGTFYLVNSSFHRFPGLPIYSSKDLRDWPHVGNAINRPEQLSLKEANTVGFPIGPGRILVATCGLLASTIRYHNGTFYITCKNAKTDNGSVATKSFYVSTKDISSNVWSDPIWFDFQGIDTSLFFGDDGEVYVQGPWREGKFAEWKCTIRQVEIDIATCKHLSPVRELWIGFAGKDDAEGPHINKKVGHYYLLTAESGTFEHHMIAMARSADIWGPYESYASIYYDFLTESVCFGKTIKLAGGPVLSTHTVALSGKVDLRIETFVKEYVLSYRSEKGEWVKLESVDTKEFTALEFSGPILDIFASGEREHNLRKMSCLKRK